MGYRLTKVDRTLIERGKTYPYGTLFDNRAEALQIRSKRFSKNRDFHLGSNGPIATEVDSDGFARVGLRPERLEATTGTYDWVRPQYGVTGDMNHLRAYQNAVTTGSPPDVHPLERDEPPKRPSRPSSPCSGSFDTGMMCSGISMHVQAELSNTARTLKLQQERTRRMSWQERMDSLTAGDIIQAAHSLNGYQQRREFLQAMGWTYDQDSRQYRKYRGEQYECIPAKCVLY